MNVIDQRLIVKEWPLMAAGEEIHFGYIVGMGLFPVDPMSGERMAYVDFQYGDAYSRYRLPGDYDLKQALLLHLQADFETYPQGGDTYGNLWITRTNEGYLVNLP